MQDHTVTIDNSTSPAGLAFADNFNVAVPFIDRHLDEGRGDKTAIFSATGGRVSYGELALNVNKVGNCLNAMGIAAGERVLMIIKDAPEFYYVFWGAIKAGKVPVPLNTLLRAKDFQYMIEDSACAALVYSPEFADEVEPALKATSHKPVHVMRTTGDETSLLSCIKNASPTLEPAPASASSDCFWLYSSGTTGRSKGTVHAHANMVVTSQYYAMDILGLREDDVCFSAAKLFFAYGLGNGMTFPLWAGASAVLLPGPPTPQSTFEVIERFKPSIFFGVPTLYAAQLQALEADPRHFAGLRRCVSAGEALPGDIYRRWLEKTGVSILDGIGSTEALHIFISNRTDDIKPGSSGKIVPGYEARILDDAGEEITGEQSGRLMIKGASTAGRYWNNPEKTAATMIGGWLDTGDTYFRDAEGYYHFCGRNDDMLKVGGIWCSPFEIEARLIEHPKVLEAAVVGRADDANLVKPAAFVVLRDGVEADEQLSEELMQHCKSGLAKYKYPRWLSFVEDLPKTATGKVQRFKLR